MNKDKALERARKIKELSERGIGGEKENATNMLNKLLKKYNLSLDDLEGEKIISKIFTYKNKIEQKLILQLIANVCPDANGWFLQNKKAIRLEAEVSLVFEVDLKYSIYKDALQQHLEDSFSAFVHVNNLYAAPNKNYKPTAKDIEEAERARRLALMMRKTQVNKQLEQF